MGVKKKWLVGAVVLGLASSSAYAADWATLNTDSDKYDNIKETLTKKQDLSADQKAFLQGKLASYFKSGTSQMDEKLADIVAQAMATNTSFSPVADQVTGVKYFSVKSTIGGNANNDGAQGPNSIAVGPNAKATGNSSLAVGKNANSEADDGFSIAIGPDSKNTAKSQASVALGYSATTHGWYDVALGGNASTGTEGVQDGLSIAIGYAAKTLKKQSIAMGVQANAKHANTVVLGSFTNAEGENGVAVGTQAKANSLGAVALGQAANVTNTGYKGIAIGAHSYVGSPTPQDTAKPSVPSYGHVVDRGNDDKTPSTEGMLQQNSIAIGMLAKAFGYQDTAIGGGAEAHDTNTLAVGLAAIARGHYSTAIGKYARTFADRALAVGYFSEAQAEDTAAFGNQAFAIGRKSLALGDHARAFDESSVAIGSSSIAKEAKDAQSLYTGEAVKQSAGIISVGNPQYSYEKNSDTHEQVTVPASYRRIVNVAGGVDDHDAVTINQLKTVVKATGLTDDEIAKINDPNEANKPQTIVARIAALEANTNNQDNTVAYYGVSTAGNKTKGNSKGEQAFGNDAVVIGPDNFTQVDKTLTADNKDDFKATYDVTIVGTKNSLGSISFDKNNNYAISGKYTIGSTLIGTKNTIAGWGGTVVGEGNKVTDGAIAIGVSNEAYGQRAIAIGDRADAIGTDSLAVGFGAKAAYSAQSLGGYSEAKSLGSLAIGNKAIVEKDAGAGVAIGYYSLNDRSGGEYGYIPGANKTIHNTDELAEYLGKTDEWNQLKAERAQYQDYFDKRAAWSEAANANTEAQAEFNKKYAEYIAAPADQKAAKEAELIAAQKKVDETAAVRAEKEQEMHKDPNKEAANKVSTRMAQFRSQLASSYGAVSVGNEKEGITRQIINVAAGSEDTDAVNVFQLKQAVKLTDDLKKATGLTDDEIAKINDPDAQDKPKTIVERIKDLEANGGSGDITGNDQFFEDKKDNQNDVVDANGNKLVKGDDGKWYKKGADGTADKAQGEQKPARVLKGISYVGNVETGEYKKTLGEAVKIYGNETVKAKDGYVATNVITENTKDGLQILFAEKPEFKGVSLKDGKNSATINPSGEGNITVDDGQNGQNGKTTIGKDGISTNGQNGISVEGDKGTTKIEGGKVAVDGKDGKPGEIVILDGKPGKDGKVITLDNEGNLVVGEKGENGTDGITTIITKDNIGEVINGKDGKDGIVEDNDQLFEDKKDDKNNVVDADGNKLIKGDDDKWYKKGADGTADKAEGEKKPARVLKGIRYVGDLNTAEYKKTLGEEVKIYGNKDVKAKDGYVAKNVVTENTAEGLQILFAEKPEFKGLNLKGDDGITTTLTPDGNGNVVITDGTDGNNGQNGKTTIGKDGISVEGDKGTTKIEGGKVEVDGKDGKPGEIVILDGKPGKDGKVITLDNEGNLVVGEKGENGTDGITTIITKDNIGEIINGKDGKDGIVENNDQLFEDKKDDDNDVVDADGNKLIKGDDDKWYKKGADGTADKAQGEQKPARVLKGISYVGNVDSGEYKKTLGEEVKIYGNKDVTAKDGYVAKNVVTENTADGLQILFAEKPEFKGVSLKDGKNSATIAPSKEGNITVDDGQNGKNGKTTIGKDGISIKGKDGADGAPGKTVTITVNQDGDAVVGKDGKDGATKIVTEDNIKDILSGKTPGTDAGSDKGIIADLINPITLEAEGNGVSAGDTNASKSFNPLDKNQKLNISAGEGLKWKIEEGKWTLNVDKDALGNMSGGGNSTGITNDNVQVDNKGVVVGKDGKDGEPGKDGSVVIGKDGKDGKGGTDGANGITITGPKGEDGTTQIVHVGKDGISGTNGKDGKDAKGFDLGTDGLTVINGKDGENGKSVYGADGMTITGPKGEDGKPGKTVIIKADQVDMGGNRIENVAPGVEATDAVNKGQLDEEISRVSTEIGNVNGKLGRMQTESDRGDALNAALAALKPIQFNPYERSQIMAGVGLYKGKQAVALGVGHYSNESTFVHAGLSYAGSSDLMANLGVTWRFGTKEDRDYLAKRPERYADGPISSVYVLQDEMIALQQENQQIRNENQQIREENEKMKAQIERLLQAVGLQ